MDVNIYKTLKKSLMFNEISEDIFDKIIKNIFIRINEYNKSEILFFEGDSCSSIGIVIEGELEINKGSIIGKKINISRLKCGDIFAEAVIFSNNNLYPATIEAIKNSKVVYISRNDIINLCTNYPILLERFMGLLSNKINMLNKKVSLLSMKSIRQKIIFYIVNEGKSNNKNYKYIKINKQKFADLIGVQRPSLSRELSNMKAEKIVEIDGKVITIITSTDNIFL